MIENFKIEIINPNNILLKTETKQVIIPAYEGLMTILKDHIPMVTFLRPGLIEVELNNKKEKFYVEEGTVEFSKDNLLILSSSVKNVNELNKEKLIEKINESKKQIDNSNIKDKEKYFLNYKIDTLEQITQ